MSIRDAKALSQLLLLKQRGFSFLARTRKFSSSKTRHEWRKESPTGGLTEVYTFTPDSQTVWPDPTLGVFSNIDHRFTFPGNVGFCFGNDGPEERPCNDAATKDNPIIKKISKIDILEVKTTREHQAQVRFFFLLIITKTFYTYVMNIDYFRRCIQRMILSTIQRKPQPMFAQNRFYWKHFPVPIWRK